MYNSQYYTCEQIDQRLLQGYLDDYNSQNNTNLTKDQFLTLLFNTIGRNSTVDNLVTQIGYYECDTNGSTAAKAINVANYALFAGGSIKVKFINKNTANNATLNINSQGAKALYYQGERASATNSWDDNEVVEIYYDGTSYYANNINGGSGSGVYDVSKEHPTSGPNSDGKFTLEYILNSSNVNELIPVNKRYPGMSIQFVSTSDNKYVQYRLMTTAFSTTESDWAICSDDILIENPEFIRVYTDKDNRILWAIKTDGTIYFGAGVPPQVVDYITNALGTFNSSDYADVMTFLGNLIDGDTLATLLSAKVDKVEGKSLIDSEFAASKSVVENPEYLQVTTDIDNKILEGIKSDGKKVINIDVEVSGKAKFEKGLDINVASVESFQDSEERIELKIDSENKIISYRDKKGVLHEEAGVHAKEVVGKNAEFEEVNISGEITMSNEARTSLKENLESVADTKTLNAVYNALQAHITDANGKEKYSSLPVFNVERKARQFEDVYWTPLHPIPTINDGQYYTNPRYGLPYTSCGEVDKFVGIDITLKTFMTAINNPYSMAYTENLKDNISGYGFTYHPGRRTIGGWTGVVCSSFVNWATGDIIGFGTPQYEYLKQIGDLVEVYGNSAQGLCIGDLLWEEGHVRLVQNLWRNENGLVTKVEVSEDAGHTTKLFKTPYNTVDVSLDDFDTDMASRHAIAYRRTRLYENIKYEPSPFVRLEGETQEPYVYNDDICTFAGDYACFREGFKIVLNYNLKSIGTWNAIELYKNDVLFGTYQIDVDTSVHSYDLSSLNLSYGKYKARMTNGTNYSDYTYFEILETNVSYDGEIKEKTKITFDSSNGKPLCVSFHRLNGGDKATYAFTKKDIERGYCVINPIELIKQQYNNLSIDNETYCKVYFVGDYGRVTNEPFITNLND